MQRRQSSIFATVGRSWTRKRFVIVEKILVIDAKCCKESITGTVSETFNLIFFVDLSDFFRFDPGLDSQYRLPGIKVKMHLYRYLSIPVLFFACVKMPWKLKA